MKILLNDNRIKSVLFFLAFLTCASVSAGEDCVVLDNGLIVTQRQSLGQDTPYPFDLEEDIPTAPEGYAPFFIEHYGRHGSRFAYSDVYYDLVKNAFDRADSLNLLTPLGKSVKADFDRHYPLYHIRMGDLTEMGWNQHLRLGCGMAESYPAIFKSPAARVSAVSSDSRRAMMSMAGFCMGLGQACPALKMTVDQGNCTLYATNPRSGRNPFRREYPVTAFPFSESDDEFCMRKTNCCPDVLSRLFTDPETVLAVVGKSRFIRKLYILAVGMNSLNPGDRTDFSSVLTAENLARLWEVDNYQRYHEYYDYPVRIIPVLDDMVDGADEAICENRVGASLRFGHDHVVLPLLVLLRLNGFTRHPASADEISAVYPGFCCPMAGNVQLVFYRSEKNPDILVNIRLNGRNASVDGLDCVCDGFYRWDDYRAAIKDGCRRLIYHNLKTIRK